MTGENIRGERMAPATAVRRILSALTRRRTPLPPGAEAGRVEPPPRRIVPDMHETEEYLNDLVDGLAARGALDEGHGDLFHRLVDGLVEVWDTGGTTYEREHREHLDRLARTEIELQATHALLERRIAAADARSAELDGEISSVLDEMERSAAVLAERRRLRRAARAERRRRVPWRRAVGQPTRPRTRDPREAIGVHSI